MFEDNCDDMADNRLGKSYIALALEEPKRSSKVFFSDVDAL